MIHIRGKISTCKIYSSKWSSTEKYFSPPIYLVNSNASRFENTWFFRKNIYCESAPTFQKIITLGNIYFKYKSVCDSFKVRIEFNFVKQISWIINVIYRCSEFPREFMQVLKKNCNQMYFSRSLLSLFGRHCAVEDFPERILHKHPWHDLKLKNHTMHLHNWRLLWNCKLCRREKSDIDLTVLDKCIDTYVESFEIWPEFSEKKELVSSLCNAYASLVSYEKYIREQCGVLRCKISI